MNICTKLKQIYDNETLAVPNCKAFYSKKELDFYEALRYCMDVVKMSRDLWASYDKTVFIKYFGDMEAKLILSAYKNKNEITFEKSRFYDRTALKIKLSKQYEIGILMSNVGRGTFETTFGFIETPVYNSLGDIDFINEINKLRNNILRNNSEFACWYYMTTGRTI